MACASRKEGFQEDSMVRIEGLHLGLVLIRIRDNIWDLYLGGTYSGQVLRIEI